MSGIVAIISRATDKLLHYDVQGGYITATVSLTEGALNENYFLVNVTATGQKGTYTITADNKKYVLRITSDGNLVVTKAGQSSQLNDQFQYSKEHFFADCSNGGKYYLTVTDDGKLTTVNQPNERSNFILLV